MVLQSVSGMGEDMNEIKANDQDINFAPLVQLLESWSQPIDGGVRQIFDQARADRFTCESGDTNGLHTPAGAAECGLSEPVAHGMALASMTPLLTQRYYEQMLLVAKECGVPLAEIRFAGTPKNMVPIGSELWAVFRVKHMRVARENLVVMLEIKVMYLFRGTEGCGLELVRTLGFKIPGSAAIQD